MERLDLSYLPAIVCVNLIYRGASSLALIAGKTRRLCKSLAGPGSNKHSCDRRPKYLQLYHLQHFYGRLLRQAAASRWPLKKQYRDTMKQINGTSSIRVAVWIPQR
jgi:hypothetical protein